MLRDDVVEVDILRKLQDESYWDTVKQYNWWDGWWRADASNPVEELIQSIWHFRLNRDDVAGFEWWSNGYRVGDGLDWHQDKDEEMYTQGKIVTPIMGCVYWPVVQDLQGGLFETERVSIKPKENSVVIFNSGEMHRVTPILGGKRRSIAINIWKEKPKTFL